MAPSGAGDPRGLAVVLDFAVPLPKTLLMARSMAALPLALGSFSTFRLLDGPVPLFGVPLAIPSPTGVASAWCFLDLPVPGPFLVVSCAFGSASGSVACPLLFLFAANACFLSLLRAAASSAICCAAAERVAAPSRRDRSASLWLVLGTRFSAYAQCVVLPHLASSLNSFSRCGQISSMRDSCLLRASFAVDMTWFFSSSETSISCIFQAACLNRCRRGKLVGSKTAA